MPLSLWYSIIRRENTPFLLYFLHLAQLIWALFWFKGQEESEFENFKKFLRSFFGKLNFVITTFYRGLQNSAKLAEMRFQCVQAQCILQRFCTSFTDIDKKVKKKLDSNKKNKFDFYLNFDFFAKHYESPLILLFFLYQKKTKDLLKKHKLDSDTSCELQNKLCELGMKSLPFNVTFMIIKIEFKCCIYFLRPNDFDQIINDNSLEISNN
ncbi:hypothetical protein BpHYR1_039560 [Brachionus plicatilis]|uniref:Uncharacterized protein n=1 Tax=Brachionus plicatilis TaxID=10195 RepID=A0A3M7QTJ5_BRAPC|nr:hypothetical protein BpHYR1_039560 [Brachionus plicatilis]